MTKKTIIITILLALGFILPQTVLGIGQMTKPIIIKDALRGQSMESILVLYNTEEKEIVYELTADGNIASWVSFYSIDDPENPISEIKVPAKSNIKAIARFTVPNDTPNGEYTGDVAIISAPEETEGGKVNVSVGTRISRQVSITVTDKEIIKLNASVIPSKYDLGKNESLNIRVIYDNRGNVAIAPQIQLKIKKDGRIVSNVIYPYPESEPLIKPFARHEIPAIEVPTSSFDSGRYLAETSVSQNGKEIFTHSFKFSVDMLGGFAMTSSQNGIVKGIFDSANLKINWILFIITAIMIVVLFFKSRQLKAKNAQEDQIK